MDLTRLMKKHLLQVQPYVAGRPIREEKNVLKLASNENLLGVPESVKRKIQEIASNLNLYPDDGSYFLKKKLAEYYKIDEDYIFPTSGAVEAIYYVAQVFLDEGDETIMSKPGFPIFNIVGKIQNAVCIFVDVDRNFVADVDEMVKRVNDKTKVVWLDNPNNPCGTIVERDGVLKLLDAINGRCILVYDEAYVDFVEPDADYINGLELIKEHENVIVMRTYSKIFGMAGIRSGTIIAHPDIVSILSKVRIPFNVNSVAQACLMAAMEEDEFYRRSVETNAKMRSLVSALLNEYGFYYVPSHTNFVLVDTGVDCVLLAEEMGKDGVFVRPMKGVGLPKFIRVSFPAKEEDCLRFIESLNRSVQKLRAQS